MFAYFNWNSLVLSIIVTGKSSELTSYKHIHPPTIGKMSAHEELNESWKLELHSPMALARTRALMDMNVERDVKSLKQTQRREEALERRP